MRTGQAQPTWTDGAIALLTRHRWPGNVRELANIIERLSILHAGVPVETEDVAAVISIDNDMRRGNAATPALPDPSALDASLTETLDDYEKASEKPAQGSSGKDDPKPK